MLFFLLALPIVFLIAYLLLPYFTELLGINITPAILFTPGNLAAFMLLSAITGLISGLYPALFLARQNVIEAMSHLNGRPQFNFNLRKSLVVFQFATSIILILSCVFVYKQLKFINAADLGFNKNQLIILPYQVMGNHSASFKTTLLENPNIESISISNWNLGERYTANGRMEDQEDPSRQLNFAYLFTDFDFIQTLQMQVLYGRTFSNDYSADNKNIDSILEMKSGKLAPDTWMNLLSSRSIMITEKTAKALHLQPPYVGQVLRLAVAQGTIIGVIKDFQGVTLHEKTPLLILSAAPKMVSGYSYVRLRSGNLASALEHIQHTWKKFFPTASFSFRFADEKVQALYENESRLVHVLTLFAVIAIMIASSGLFSLVALSIQQKTREIGIRKILGANTLGITRLLSWGYIKLILIAIVIAIPFAWYTLHLWLEDFEYRTEIQPGYFFLAGSGSILLTVLIVGAQTFWVARANPAKVLKVN